MFIFDNFTLGYFSLLYLLLCKIACNISFYSLACNLYSVYFRLLLIKLIAGSSLLYLLYYLSSLLKIEMFSIRPSEAKGNRSKFCLRYTRCFFFNSCALGKFRQWNLINIVAALLRRTLEILCNPSDQATTVLPNSVVWRGW